MRSAFNSLAQEPWFILALCFLLPPLGIYLYLKHFFISYKKERFASLWFLFCLFLAFFACYKAYFTFEPSLAAKKFTSYRSDFNYKQAYFWFNKLALNSEEDKLFHKIAKVELLKPLKTNLEIASLKQEAVLDLKNYLNKKIQASYAIDEAYLKRLNRKSLFSIEATSIKDSLTLENFCLEGLNLLLDGLDQASFKFFLEKYLYLVANNKDYSSYQRVEFYLSSYFILFKEASPQAKAWLNDSVLQSPFNLRAYYLKAKLAEKEADYLSAFNNYLHIFSFDINYFDCYLKLKELAKFKAELNIKALDLFYQAERTRFKENNYLKAITLNEQILGFENIKNLYPLYLETLYNQAFLYRVQLNNNQKALIYLKQILALGKTLREEQALYHYAMAMLYLNELDKADQAFRRLINEYPLSEHISRVEFMRYFIKVLEITQKWVKNVRIS